MVVKRGDMPKGFQIADDRVDRWLWNYIARHIPTPPVVAPPSGGAISILAQSHIFYNQDSTGYALPLNIRSIHAAKERELVSAAHIKWIENENYRLLIWLFYQIFKHQYLPPHQMADEDIRITTRHYSGGHLYLSNPISIHDLPKPNIYWAVIGAIDDWEIDKSTKEYELRRLEDKWLNQKSPEKEISWIERSNKEQLSWAWEYLSSKRMTDFIPNPSGNTEQHLFILAALDLMPINNWAERTLFLQKMRRTWSQRKYRASEHARQPVYMPLNRTVHKTLKKMAYESGRKPYEIIEELIMNADYPIKK